jgi:hypothetical protein
MKSNLLLLAFLGLAACSSSSSGSADAGAADSASPDGGGDGANTDGGETCPSFTNGAQQITDQSGTGAMPVGTGGTIADGTYYATDSKLYPGGTGAVVRTSRDALAVRGSTMEVHQTDASSDVTATATVTLAGAAITLTFTCPPSLVGTTTNATYTATPTTLTLFDGTKNRVTTYTKQ